MRSELGLQLARLEGAFMPNLPSATKYRVHAHPVSAGRDQAASQQQGHEAPPSIIPVGQEPRRQLVAEQTPPTGSSGRGVAAAESIATKKPRGKARGGLRSPEKLFRVKDRLLQLRIFTLETMGSLRRAEITVWLAIFNCEFRGQAQIGYARLSEVTDLSQRHVGKAIKSLVGKGLLKVVSRGQYRPSRSSGGEGAKTNGFSSIYRVHPRVSEPKASQPVASESAKAKPKKPTQPR